MGNHTSLLPALVVTVVALLSIGFWGGRVEPSARSDRYTSIDGLRGYLALGVFLHHACIWHFFLQTGDWKVPPSNFYTHLGQSSVALFFMITGFLFFSRIITSREAPIDWSRLLLSRVLRLVPLYLLVVLLLALIVIAVSGAKLNVAPLQALTDVLRWTSFTIFGAPDLNMVADTWRITAGVTWSLPYEWLFYVSLPLQGMLLRTDVPRRYLLASATGVVAILLVWIPLHIHLLTFLGGIGAAVAARFGLFRQFARSKTATVLAILCLLLLVVGFANAGRYPQIILLSLAFTIIACGNSGFGILTHRWSRSLGEIAYSVYLLHGMLLFVLFTFVLGAEQSKALSPALYWGVVIALTPVLVSLSVLSFARVERPAIASTNRVLGWVRGRVGSPRQQ